MGQEHAYAVGRLARIPNLAAYFPDYAGVGTAGGASTDAVVLAMRDEAALARSTAGDRPVRLIDDGLIRSIGGRRSGAPPISLLIDAPERLYSLLGSAGWETPALLNEARSLAGFKLQQGLSQTAHIQPPPPVLATDHEPRVLVLGPAVDPPLFGSTPADKELKSRILAAAQHDHPGRTIIAWGFGRARERKDGVLFIAGDFDLKALFARVQAVYSAGGLTGFEALLAGRRVHCFGRPFYAGWGLTIDHAGPTHDRARTLDELFAAAYLVLPTYVDPLNGVPCTARIAFERLASFNRHARRVAGQWVGLNLDPTKRAVMQGYLGGPLSHFRLQGEVTSPSSRFAVWASRPNRKVLAAEQRAPARVVRFEDGFLRSVGLGSDFIPAASLVMDEGGIHYDHRSGSDLEQMLQRGAFPADLLTRAQALRARIVELGLSKYNPSRQAAVPTIPPGRTAILVPGQVGTDASVRTGGGGMDNLTLLKRVREANPQAHLIYKPHPDVVAGNRPGALTRSETLAVADAIAEQADILSCLAAVDEVHTLSSLVGFEALLRDKPVTVHGWPFYAGWGLTTDLGPEPAPQRGKASLSEMIAAALILYPLYIDPVSGLPCEVEVVVERLAAMGGAAPPKGPRRILAALRQMVRPARPRLY